MTVFVRLLPLVLAAIVLNPIAPTPGCAQATKPKSPIEIVPLTGHDGSVVTVAFSPDRAAAQASLRSLRKLACVQRARNP